MEQNKQNLTSSDIEKVQILTITKDGQKLMSISDDPILIRCIVSWCQFMRLKDELFEQCSLKELMDMIPLSCMVKCESRNLNAHSIKNHTSCLKTVRLN